MRLVMWIYMLLVMWISSVMGMSMTIGSMVMPYVMMPTRSMVPTTMSTMTRVVMCTTGMVWVHCMCMVHVVMGRMMPTGSMVMSIIYMVGS